MPEKLLTQENSNKVSILYILAIPVIIFLYFLQWKTHVLYGDDVSAYNQYLGLKTFGEKLNMSLAAQKFRPVQGIGIQLLIDSFEKDASGYYWFNVLVQSVNTIIFSAVLNLYLRSVLLSLFFGLLLGLSRFSLFNITQLLNGGVLEGLAMTFFLLFLFFTVKCLRAESADSRIKTNIFCAILFANLGMYTHERYVVLFPFLVLVLIFGDSVRKIAQKEKLGLIALCLASILLNVVIKKYVYGIPFFVGTGGVNIEFSFAAVFSFLLEGVFAIFLYNTGPEYLVGIKYPGLSHFHRILTIILILVMLGVLVIYLVRELKKRFISPATTNFFLLTILFFMSLAPAIVTIRLEQRWLQASFSVFVLLLVIAVSSFRFGKDIFRISLCAFFVLAFLSVERDYLNKGSANIYMMSSARLAATFKKSIDNEGIHLPVKNLFIWERRRDINAENAANFTLANGDFFEFYGVKRKNLIYIDSIYERLRLTGDTTFLHFNPRTDQMIYVNDKVYDITNKFIRDSLKNFDTQQIEADPDYQ